MNDAASHFLHRDALQLMGDVRGERSLEPGQGATSQLLGPLCCDVNKEKPAGDGCGAFAFNNVGGSSILLILLNHGFVSVLEKS